MSILQERLMQVLSDTGRVAVPQNGLMARLQQRWPTPHGYAPQSVETALKTLQAEGKVHCSPAGKWTRLLDLTQKRVAAAPAAADPIVEEHEPIEADDESTQETEVSKTKVCTGKCGKEKPVGEFYANCNSCKRCVLDRQKELKAAKEKGAKPEKVAAAAKLVAAPKSSPIKNLKAKAAAAKNGNGSMVAISFALHVEDIHGVFHDISVALPTVQRLVTELRQYA
jgi:hypothetical protein